MKIEPDALLAAFEGQSEPLSVTQIADALDLAAGDVHVALSELLRQDVLVRVRRGDGVLRYTTAGSSDDATTTPDPEPEQATQPEPAPEPAAPLATEQPELKPELAAVPDVTAPKPTLMARIAQLLEREARPLSNSEVKAALGDDMTRLQVKNALKRLGRAGTLRMIGNRSQARWVHASGAALAQANSGSAFGTSWKPGSVSALPADASARPKGTAKKPKLQSSTTSRLGPKDYLAAAETEEKTRKALEFSARVADDAYEVYVHSVVNPHVYGPLKLARDQAREALHAFNTRL